MMIWQDRNMSECFKVFYVKLYVHSLVDKLKWFYENARFYHKIYGLSKVKNEFMCDASLSQSGRKMCSVISVVMFGLVTVNPFS